MQKQWVVAWLTEELSTRAGLGDRFGFKCPKVTQKARFVLPRDTYSGVILPASTTTNKQRINIDQEPSPTLDQRFFIAPRCLIPVAQTLIDH